MAAAFQLACERVQGGGDTRKEGATEVEQAKEGLLLLNCGGQWKVSDSETWVGRVVMPTHEA